MVRVFRLRFPGRHPRPVILSVHASYSGADSSLCPLCRQLFHPPIRQFVLWFAGGSSGPPPFFAIILMVMSVPTILIGMLPTYDQIGGLATVCLLMSRLVQGFGAGSES